MTSNHRTVPAATGLTLLVSLFLVPAPSIGREEKSADVVTVLKTPDGGIQPQAVIDARGTIHLIYFKGEPAAGDLFYVRREPGQESFTAPIKVNSQPGSAIAIGTIRGGQIALGKGGRVHVAWNGSRSALPRPSAGGSPMLYSRSVAAPSASAFAFEPQRDLMTKTTDLDGGGTVAADQEGHVYVAWHGRTEDARRDETGRRMWIARSADEGATFEPEASAVELDTGACGCCGTRSLADRRGNLYLMYRAATSGVERDMYLLSSHDHGARFQARSLGPWRTGMCPMSSESMADAASAVLAAWETNGQVFFTRVDRQSGAVQGPISPPGRAVSRKHPAVAASDSGETILIWTEGTGWQKGGALAWQVFDSSGQPKGKSGFLEGAVPVWGLATVVARPGGGFVVIH
jgi:hypothetical protein